MPSPLYPEPNYKVKIYPLSLSPHNLDALRAVLQKQFDENLAQIRSAPISGDEIMAYERRNSDLSANLYLIERAQT